MNILYFHDRLLRDIYRCAQVRSRLQNFIQSHEIDMILVSTHSRIKEGLKPTDFLAISKDVVLYNTQDNLDIEGVKLYEDSLIIENTVFKPVDGTIFMISTQPQLNFKTIFMDFFADERFEDFHSDLSDEQLVDLQLEIKKKTKYN